MRLLVFGLFAAGSLAAATITVTGTYTILSARDDSSTNITLTGDGFSLQGGGGLATQSSHVLQQATFFYQGGFHTGALRFDQQPDGSWTGSATALTSPLAVDLFAAGSTTSFATTITGSPMTIITFGGAETGGGTPAALTPTPEPVAWLLVACGLIVCRAKPQSW